MLRHAMKHQGKTYSCGKCPKKTSSPYNMRQHVQGNIRVDSPVPVGKMRNGPGQAKAQKKHDACEKIMEKRNLVY